MFHTRRLFLYLEFSDRKLYRDVKNTFEPSKMLSKALVAIVLVLMEKIH